MTLWRYKAAAARSAGGTPETVAGELAASSAAEVRASLRRIGLQAIEVRPVRTGSIAGKMPAVTGPLVEAWLRHLRARRKIARADLYDGLATMLDSGLPLLEAVSTLIGERTDKPSRFTLPPPRRMMLIDLRESLRGGSPLDEAMARHPAWFDQMELAMVRAGQHNGDLPGVLRSLAQRHQRSGELGRRLAGALTYPAVIAAVGLGVVIFLSVKTLPDLTAILQQADVAIPALTKHVMAAGQFVYRWWWLLFALAMVGGAMPIMLPAAMQWLRSRSPDMGREIGASRSWTFMPKVIRRIGVAQLSLRLAELIRTGIPMVEALRVLAPTAPGIALSQQIVRAAERVERGDELAEALDDPRWFDLEYRRLLAIGLATGELDALLERIGRRYQRQAERLIDQLAALLEPAVLLTLAVLIGIVVMAAILPLIRLQEVLG